MEDTVGPALARIGHYRDRFSAGGLVIGFVSALMALWTTAPALDVSLPLVGGAQAGLNVGYVLMAGITVLAIAIMWLVGPLLSMRRLQEAVLQDVERQSISLSATQRRELLGPFVSENADKRWDLTGYHFSAGIRYLIFFVCPLLGQFWIAEEYFRKVHAYDRDVVIDRILGEASSRPEAIDPSKWRIDPKSKLSVTDYFARSKPKDAAGRILSRFTVANSDLEKNCVQLWVLERLETAATRASISDAQKRLASDLTSRTEDLKCVVDAFPRYELALNSWLNVFFFLLSLWIAKIAWSLYYSRGLAEKLDAIHAARATPATGAPEGAKNP